MKMNKHISDSYTESVYYINTLSQLIIRMVEFAVNSPTHPALDKLSEYYLRFKAYLRIVTTNTQTFARYADAIHKLPLSLDTEEILDWETKGRQTVNSTFQELAQIAAKQDLNSFNPPKAFQEAIRNVEQYLSLPVNPDIARLQEENKQLIELLETTNNKLRGNITMYPDGTVEFHSPTGNVYSGIITKNTNGYNLLKELSRHSVNTIISCKELGAKLNPVRQQAYNDTDLVRRVTDTVTTIRNNLGLPEDDTIFIVNNGYGLKYPMKFVPHSS